MRKRNTLVCGVGINDADYHVNITEIVNGKHIIVWSCPFYRKWAEILRHGYSEIFKNKYPTYQNSSVVEEWHRFSVFKSWMEQQDWQGKDLDKDILTYGNKVYGPDACVFVDHKVNGFLSESNANRGQYPIGVCYYKPTDKFKSSCKCVITGKRKHIGYYATPEEAHQAWLAFKLKQAHILAAEQTDPRVAEALISRYENYQSKELVNEQI